MDRVRTVLVVDDLAIFRDLVTAALRQIGYCAVGASNGIDATRLVKNARPDLILLDVAMPGMDGLAFLEQLRKSEETVDLPVILLTATADKHCVLQASKFKARDYLLKSAFSLDELLARVQRHAPLPAAPPAPVVMEAAPVEPGDGEGKKTGERPRPSRKESVKRAMEAMPVKTLGGVVAEVLSVAASPRSDLSTIAAMISQDVTLSARVLQAANSAAYAVAHGAVTNIHDAVWTIGSSAVRNIAVSLGIYEAMPKNSPDGFNPILCWQHSLAVAQMCEHLAGAGAAPEAGAAYLVGLCHDLGEIVFREQFGPEFRNVIECQKRTGRPRAEIEREILGLPHSELVQVILQHFGLPAAIRGPIEQFHSTASSADVPLVRILRLADTYADGLMLAASPSSLIGPFTKNQCRVATGKENPPAPNANSFCCQIQALTCLLAKLGRQEEQAMNTPMFPHGAARIWLARDPGLSELDPLHTFLSSLADVELSDRLPYSEEVKRFEGIVVAARSNTTPGFEAAELEHVVVSAGAHRPSILWLVGALDKPPVENGRYQARRWPVAMSEIARFVSELPAQIISPAAA